MQAAIDALEAVYRDVGVLCMQLLGDMLAVLVLIGGSLLEVGRGTCPAEGGTANIATQFDILK